MLTDRCEGAIFLSGVLGEKIHEDVDQCECI